MAREGFGAKQLWPNEGTVLELIWRVEENYEKPQSGYLVAWPKYKSVVLLLHQPPCSPQ
jgi:hypothetical protein